MVSCFKAWSLSLHCGADIVLREICTAFFLDVWLTSQIFCLLDFAQFAPQCIRYGFAQGSNYVHAHIAKSDTCGQATWPALTYHQQRVGEHNETGSWDVTTSHSYMMASAFRVELHAWRCSMFPLIALWAWSNALLADSCSIYVRKSGPAGTHAQGSKSQFWLSVSFPVDHQQCGGRQVFKEPNRQSFPPQFCSAGSPGKGCCGGGE